jgi:hypothetical protein
VSKRELELTFMKLIQRRIRAFVPIVCVLLLVVPGFGQTPGLVIQEQVAQLPRDKTFKVKLKSGRMLKGKVLSISQGSFEFQPERETIFKSRPTTVTLVYRDVQSVKPAGHKTLIIGLVVLGAILAGLAVGVSHAPN